MAKLEITKMITVSTWHVKEETCKWLSEVCEGQQPDDSFPPFYKKGEYGFFVYCDSTSIDKALDVEDFPEDLMAAMFSAFIKGCELLCLDSDGPITKGFERYKWR